MKWAWQLMLVVIALCLRCSGEPIVYRWSSVLVEGSTMTNTLYLVSQTNLTREFWYRTRPGSARENIDYMASSGKLLFSGESRNAEVVLTALDNGKLNEEKSFFLEIADSPEFGEASILQELPMVLRDDEEPWILDLTFQPKGAPDNPVVIGAGFAVPPLMTGISTIALQSDGKVVMGGTISSESGLYRGVMRLNSDGTLDSSFAPGTRLGGVLKILLSSKGNMYGWADSTPGGEVVKLDAQGEVKWSQPFAPRYNYYYAFQPGALLLKENESVLVGGFFTNIAGISRKHLALLDSDGKVQPEFNLSPNDGITAMAATAGGKTIIGGKFSSIGGTRCVRLARLTAKGELDTDFDSGALLDAEPTTIAVASDGKILVSGYFNRQNGSPRDRLIRLNADGSLDESFSASLDEAAQAIVFDQSGRIMLGGSFNKVNGMLRHRLARLLPDGSLDSTFDPGEGPNQQVNAVVAGDSGTYLIGGYFSKIGRRPSPGVARILPDSQSSTADFADPENFAQEAYGEAHVQLQRFGDITGDLEVEVSLLPSSDPRLVEYPAWSTKLRFAAMESRTTVTIPIHNDGEVEGSETVVLQCKAAGETLAKSALLTIIDDEEPVLAQTFVPLPAWVKETKVVPSSEHLAISGYVFKGIFGLPGVVVANISGEESSFSPPEFGPEGDMWIDKTAWTPDEKLVVSGTFQTVNSIRRKNLVRLNLDGTVDQSFAPTIGFRPTDFAVQSDGKIVVGSSFPVKAGPSTSSIVRLNANGTVDSSFSSDISFDVTKIALQSDGKVLVLAGDLNQNDGQRQLIRLESTGGTDRSFQKLDSSRVGSPLGGYFNQYISNFAVTKDDSILVAGDFFEIDRIVRRGLAKLNSDGSLNRNYNVRIVPSGGMLFSREGRVLMAVGFPWEWVLFNTDGSQNRDFMAGQYDLKMRPIALLDEERIVTGGEQFGALSYTTRFAIAPLTNKDLSSLVFDEAIVTLDESEEVQELHVSRIGDVSKAITIPITVQLIDGEANDDIELLNPSLSFSELQTDQVITLRARKDGWIEKDERFRLKAGPAGVNFVPGSCELIVRDGDGRPGSLSVMALPPRTNFDRYVACPQNGTLRIANLSGQTLNVMDVESGSSSSTILPIETNRVLTAFVAAPDSSFFIIATALEPNVPGKAVLHKLLPSGELVASFTSSDFPAFISGITFAPEGKLIVTGYSDIWLPGVVLTLDSNGSVESHFPLPIAPYGALLLSEDKLLYYSFSEVRCFNLKNGVEDNSFQKITVTGSMRAVIPTKQGFILWGYVSAVNSAPRSGLARFDSQGRVDPLFAPMADRSSLSSLVVDTEGRILIFGEFNEVDGVIRRRAARLLPDGKLDLSFDPGYSFVTDSSVLTIPAVAVLANGDVLALLHSQTDDWLAGRIPSNRPFRLSLSNTSSSDWNLSIGTLPEAAYVIETSRDLMRWEPFSTNISTGYQINVSLQSSAKNSFFRGSRVYQP